MSEAKLDQIVKGAPSPNVSVPNVAAAAISEEPPQRASALSESKRPASHAPALDPLSALPSSPPQIYLNLLILEASLRSQYLALRARRRLHTFFLTLLALWIASFSYLLFVRPREDGKGAGGSPYWVIDMGEKVGFMGGVLTAILVWATGQWDRGVRWPRRWMAITNRGLRGMNLKIVVLRGPWWKRILSYPSFLFPYSSFFPSQGSSYQYVELDKKTPTTTKFAYREGHQYPGLRVEDIAAGGDHVRLLLLAKPFSPEFRENWELYRTEYWEKENERRAELSRVVKARQRDAARSFGGWRWWSGYWRISRRTSAQDVEKLQHATATHRRQESIRKRRGSALDSKPHSRSSSRSSAIAPDLDEIRGIDKAVRRHKASLSLTSRSGARPRPRDPRAFSEDSIESNHSKRGSTVSNASSSDSERSTASAGTLRLSEIPADVPARSHGQGIAEGNDQ